MEKKLKEVKKTLEVNIKRGKNIKELREVLSDISSPEANHSRISVDAYNKNLTKVTSETTNKRSFMLPLYDMKEIISFTEDDSSIKRFFILKWHEGKKVVDAAITDIIITVKNDVIKFTMIYAQGNNGAYTKTTKCSTTTFEFDDHEVLKSFGNSDVHESLKSVAYVLLYIICSYKNKNKYGEISDSVTLNEYLDTFHSFSEEQEFNLDSVLSMLSAKHILNESQLLSNEYLK